MKLTDIDTIAGSDTGAKLELRHPATGEKLEGSWIKLAGPDSKIAKQRRAEIRRKMRRTGRQGLDFDALEAEAAETRVAVTLSWGGIELENGAVKCTPDNVRKVYEDFPWIAEQVDEFQGDRANFIGSSSKSAASTSDSELG